jgi:hypothetical protein
MLFLSYTSGRSGHYRFWNTAIFERRRRSQPLLYSDLNIQQAQNQYIPPYLFVILIMGTIISSRLTPPC